MRGNPSRGIALPVSALPRFFGNSHGESSTSSVFHLAAFVDKLLRASFIHATIAFTLAAAQNTCLETLETQTNKTRVRTKVKAGVYRDSLYCLTSQYFFKHSDFLHLQPML
jgi:hypothetical protein